MAATTIKSFNIIDWKVQTVSINYATGEQTVDLTNTVDGYVAIGVVGNQFTSTSGHTYAYLISSYVENEILTFRPYAVNGSISGGVVHIQILYVKEGMV